MLDLENKRPDPPKIICETPQTSPLKSPKIPKEANTSLRYHYIKECLIIAAILLIIAAFYFLICI